MLENTFVVTRVYALSEILYKHGNMVVVLLACPDDHTTGLGRITDGIAQQVGQHPGYFLAVDKELPDFLRIVHFHLYSEFLSLYAIGLDSIVNQFDGLGNLRFQLQFSTLYLRHIEQLARDTEQPLTVLFNASRKFLLFGVQSSHTLVFQKLQTHHNG